MNSSSTRSRSRSRSRHYTLLIIHFTLAIVAFAPMASAASVYWDTASTGTWFTPNGWHDGSDTGALRNAPASTDGAFINGGRVTIGSGVLAASTSVQLGSVTGASGTLNILGGGALALSANSYIGNTGTGALVIENGGLLSSSANVYVGGGANGSGTLDVLAGGTFSINADFIVARQNASNGSVFVDGYFGSNNVYMGYANGSGVFVLGTNGTVRSTALSIGHEANGTGSVTIAGRWNSVSGNSNVGNAGVGTLVIENGGYLSQAGLLYVGNSGTGALTVQNGGLLSTATHFYVGGGTTGSGTVNILSGGTISVGTGGFFYVGNNGAGVVTVQSGGLLSTASTLSIATAANSSGTLNLLAGGTITSGGDCLIARANATSGYVFADGAISFNALTIGYGNGSGAFVLGTNGMATTRNMNIGQDSDGTGYVSIAGRWDCVASGNTNVGNNGTGTLVIENGGWLSTANNMYAGAAENSTGTITVLAGGTLTVNADFVVARQTASRGSVFVDGYIGFNSLLMSYVTGSGSFILGPNGTARTNMLDIGREAGGTGYVSIAGRWDSISGNSNVGNAGVGTLVIENGGWLSHAGNLYVGQGSSSSGTLNVLAGGTLTIVTDFVVARNNLSKGIVSVDGYIKFRDLLMGYGSGTGSVVINAGGTAISNMLDIAREAGSTGYVSIAGRWDSYGGNSSVGNAGTGTLIIEDGGWLSHAGNLTVANAGASTGFIDIKSTGTLTIGGNYTQNPRSTLTVALSGTRPDAPITVAGAAALSGTLRVSGLDQLNFNAVTKASELSGITIIRATGGIAGDFDSINPLDGGSGGSLPDYIDFAGIKVSEGGPLPTRYDVGYGLAWQSSPNLAHGTFTIDAGQSFEVDVQLNNRSGIESGWDGRSLTKKGDGTLILSVENAYTGATTIEAGTLRFTGPPNTTLGALVNNGVVDLGGAGNRTLSATSLAGSGTYRMTVDLGSGASDRIIIAGDATGSHRLFITGTGAMPTGDEPMPTLVSIGGVNDITHSAGGEIIGDGATTSFEGGFDYGPFSYAVEMRGHNIVIANTGLQAGAYDAINGVPGAQGVLWFDQQDNINRRLGELRAPAFSDTENRTLKTENSFWARAHAASATIGGGSSGMRRSDVDLWGVEIGYDYTWLFKQDRVTAGIFAGYGDASQKFQRAANVSSATGKSELAGAGLYAAWLSDAGWFVNTTITIARYKNSFDTADLSRNHTTADYTDSGYGIAAEIGKRFTFTSTENRKLKTENSSGVFAAGWFAEPALQGAATQINRGDYITGGAGSFPLSVHGARVTISRLRAVLRAGHAWQGNGIGWMEVAARAGATREQSSGGEITIGSNRWRPNLDGNRYEAGASFYWRPKGLRGQVYFDYEYASGANFTKPWSLSLGFRLSL